MSDLLSQFPVQANQPAQSSRLGFIDPSTIPILNTLPQFTPYPTLPSYNPRQEQYQTQFENRYGDFANSGQVTPGSAIANFSPQVQEALARFDKERVAAGRPTITEGQALGAGTTLETNTPYTPPAEPNFFENVGNDVKAILTSIPKLPMEAFKTVQELPSVPGQLADTLAHNTGLTGIGKALQLPGVNLIPGSFVAGNVLQGNYSELLKHPVFTGLDVLPYASKLAKSTSVFAAAEDAAKATAEATSESLGTLIQPKRPNPFLVNLTQKLDPATGELVPTKIGEITGNLKEGFGRTNIGQNLEAAFGDTSRNQMRLLNAHNDMLARLGMGEIPESIQNTPLASRVQPWAEQAAKGKQMFEDFKDIPIERQIELTNHITSPVDIKILPDGTTQTLPTDMRTIAQSDRELAFMDQAKQLSNENRYIKQQNDLLATPMGIDPNEPIAGEFYEGGTTGTKAPVPRLARIYKRVLDYEYGLQQKSMLRNQLDRFTDPTISDPLYIERKVNGKTHSYDTSTGVLHDTINSLDPKDPINRSVLGSWRRGDYASAASELRKNYKAGTIRGAQYPAAQEAADILLEYDKTQKQFNKVRNYSDRGLASKHKWWEQAQRNAMPARFVGPVESRMQQELLHTFQTRKDLPPEMVDNYMQLISEGDYESTLHELNKAGISFDESRSISGDLSPEDLAKLNKSDFFHFRKEMEKTWVDMKAAGVDPTFIHRVAPDQYGIVNYPNISNSPTPAISSLKSRTINTSAYVNDAQAALTHEAMEFLRRYVTEDFFQKLGNAFGTPEAELRSQYVDLAREAAARNPLLSQQAYIESMMKKDGMRPLEMDKFMPWPKAKTGVTYMERPWVPASIADNLERVFDPKMGAIARTLDPVMKLFRTTLLPLSPRWHAYNILGGLTMLMGQTGPGVFKFMREAWDMAKSGELHGLEGAPPRGFWGMPEDMVNWGKEASQGAKTAAMYQYAAGGALKKLWDSAAALRARSGFNNLVKKSYEFNGFIDDFYRSAAYLYGEDQALLKGMSEKQARETGIGLVRKVMQNWDEITPIERSVLRFAFPFYGWMKHILGYVMKYPIDHPVRTSVISSFARNELEDFNSGLPKDLLNLYFIGEVDPATGKQKAINLRGINPFSDVANYFTMAGLLGQTNPIISSIAESLGVDTQTGGPTLYPEVSYNPDTGRLEGKGGNPITNLLQNTFPAGGAAASLIGTQLGFKTRFADALRTNPEQANRMLASQFGLPVLFKSVDVDKELIRGEMNRQTAQSDALNQSRRTGNYSPAAQFPALRGYLNQIQQLGNANIQSQTPAPQYTPTQGTLSPVEMIKASLLGA